MWFRAFWGLVWLGAAFVNAPAWARLEISQVAPGIYRSRPVQSAADYRALRQYGIRTVIDLRNLRQFAMARESRRLAAMGIAYYQVPIKFPLSDNSPDRALALLANPRLHPILIHCNLGNDRNGLVVALYRMRYQGWSKEAAFAEMERYGFHHFLAGLEQYFWDYPIPSRRNNLPQNRIDQPGMPQIIAARPTEPPRASRRGPGGRRWR
jgi:protein-tyrosine phosphatase